MTQNDNLYDYRNLDSVLASPIRLAVMSLLLGSGECEFTFLREKTGATDGNLSRHLSKLEESGFIEVAKRFEGKKPVTTQKITQEGRRALSEYIANMEALLASMKNKEK